MIFKDMVSVLCDNCYVEATESYEFFYEELKSEGWSFGSKDLCPKCNKKSDISEEDK